MKSLICAVKDGIAEICLNRPHKRNALNRPAYAELRDAMREFSTHAEARVLLLRGEGVSFCAGQDLTELPELERRSEQQIRRDLAVIQDITRHLVQSPIPTVAAIQGAAAGAGAEIPMACDFRIGMHGCFFLFPEREHGLYPTNGASAILPWLMGAERAEEAMSSGERVQDEQALAYGLLTGLWPEQEFSGRVLDQCRALADGRIGRPESSIRQQRDFDLEAVLQSEIDYAVTRVS